MYRGFNVTIESYQNYHYQIGLELFNNLKETTANQLKKYVGVNGVINGSELEDDWFGTIDTHVFISHSHTDEKLAIALAGYLFEKHNIKCFVDSCVWGYANDLLRQIDDKYCWNPQSKMYDYSTRNYSTSHVHMMLSAALNKMIGKCEALFLINTPNSVETSEIINETYSPWIYSEILISKLIEKKIPLRYLLKDKEFSDRAIVKAVILNESIKIKYELDLNHLADLSQQEIINWGLATSKSPENALDILYYNKPAPKNLLVE